MIYTWMQSFTSKTFRIGELNLVNPNYFIRANRTASMIAYIYYALDIVAMALHLSGPVVAMLINYYRGTYQSVLKVLPFTGMYYIHVTKTYLNINLLYILFIFTPHMYSVTLTVNPGMVCRWHTF